MKSGKAVVIKVRWVCERERERERERECKNRADLRLVLRCGTMVLYTRARGKKVEVYCSRVLCNFFFQRRTVGGWS